MKLRAASPADLDLLARWNHQLIADEGHQNPMGLTELRERMRGWMAGGDHVCLIFCARGEDVGYALFQERSMEVHLRHFFISREHRRRGYGRTALQEMIARVWPRTKRLTVEVLAENRIGVAFWRAVGYRDYSLTLEIPPKQTSKESRHSILESRPPA